VRAVGLRPRNRPSFRMPRLSKQIEGNNCSLRKWARRGWYPAGYSTIARTKRTAELALLVNAILISENRSPFSEKHYNMYSFVG
jgi:hypothetical protein